MSERVPADRTHVLGLARDVMTAAPKTVLPTVTASAALALMRQDDIRHLVVVDEHGTLRGVLSNRDYRRILERTDPQGTIRGIHAIAVGDLMTPVARLTTARPDTPVIEIARQIVERKVGCVPVVDEHQRPVGILTQKDVLREILNRVVR